MNPEIEQKLLDILIESEHDCFPMKKTIKAIAELVVGTVPAKHEFGDNPTTTRQADQAYGFDLCRTEILNKWKVG